MKARLRHNQSRALCALQCARLSSVLDSIEGIGPVRRKALMKHFLDIEKIRQASVDELMKADGITENVAENIYKFFH